MTTLVMNYTVNPLVKLWNGIQRTLLIAGHARAAAELSRQGYHEAAKSVMLDYYKLRNEK
jgi:hypothetical protein